MPANTVLTDNPVLDFAILQVLSIVYCSDASVPMVKWQTSDNPDLRNMPLPPAAAMLGKAVHTVHGIKAVPGTQKVCLKTTGYSIQVLSSLYRILSRHYRDDVAQSLISEFRGIALLQLHYCLEALTDGKASTGEMTAVLDGAAEFMSAVGDLSSLDTELVETINNLYNKMASGLDIASADTMDLAMAARSIAKRNRLHNATERDTFLSGLVLEIMNRKSMSGLFSGKRDSSASVPLGRQFFILDALLQAYSFVMLDAVLENVFGLFNRICRYAYKEVHELFSFERSSIKYTAFDVGAMMSCLHNVSNYTVNENQKETLIELKESFIDFVLKSYYEYHEKDISRLTKWYAVSHSKSPVEAGFKPLSDAVFPKRIHLEYPGPVVDWSRKGVINQADPLFLCASLLSAGEFQEQSSDSDSEDGSVFDTFKLLLNMLT